ncbi:MAG: hypothetical protein IJU60_05340 [Acholeplasmatales bacterium]|nr:hypothetical protein [Acholeplasmatales bacterium]
MYVRVWKKNEKKYAAVVRCVRDGKKVKQEVIAYIGEVSDNQIPYLKAAYQKDKPKLVYKDGTEFDGSLTTDEEE